MYDGDNIMQKIEHEWILPTCKSCVYFGHTIEKRAAKEFWKEKIWKDGPENVKNTDDNTSSKNLDAGEKNGPDLQSRNLFLESFM